MRELIETLLTIPATKYSYFDIVMLLTNTFPLQVGLQCSAVCQLSKLVMKSPNYTQLEVFIPYH